jgi:hypothetical protein
MYHIKSKHKNKSGIFGILPSVITAIILFAATSLTAEQFESVELKLSWAPVETASGYVVQVESIDGKFKDQKKLKTNSLSLNLAPGEYKLRLASLNKFGKPAAWTTWKPVTLTGEEKVQSVQNLEKGEAAGVGPVLFRPSWLAPGLPQLLESKWKDPYGYAWMGGILIGAGAAIAETSRGNTIATNDLNDPVYLTMVFYRQPLPLLFYLKDRRENERASYNKSKLNQQILGSLITIAWITHYVKSYQSANETVSETEETSGLSPAFAIAAGPRFDHRGRPDGISAGLTFRF